MMFVGASTKGFMGRLIGSVMHFTNSRSLETLDEDFQSIAKKLGNSVSLQVANKTAGEKVRYKDAYDDEMMKRVAEVYQDDIRHKF